MPLLSEPKKPKTPVKQQNQPAEPVVTQQQQHQQQPVRTSTIIKEVKLHKNGDPTTNPVVYTYHSKEGHNFDEVVHHMGQLVPPKNGQPANALYTHDGTMKITNLTQLADVNEDHFVVAHGNYEPVEGG